MNRKVLALLAVALVAISGTAAAAGLALNPNADVYPHTTFHEDRLTISSHDVASMDMLEYEDDSGEIATIKAHVNGTEGGELVSYRADQLEDSEFGAFPRSGDEDGNVSVLDASAWTASGANVSLSQTNGSTAEGVASIQMATDGSLTSSDTASVSYTEAAIDSDAEKRVLQLIANVESLDAGAEVKVQIRDGDGGRLCAEHERGRVSAHRVPRGSAHDRQPRRGDHGSPRVRGRHGRNRHDQSARERDGSRRTRFVPR